MVSALFFPVDWQAVVDTIVTRLSTRFASADVSTAHSVEGLDVATSPCVDELAWATWTRPQPCPDVDVDAGPVTTSC